MHDRLFDNQQSLGELKLIEYAKTLDLDFPAFEACLRDEKTTAKVSEDFQLAQRLGITGTPTFLIGRVQSSGMVRVTRRITGVQSIDIFRIAIDELTSAKRD